MDMTGAKPADFRANLIRYGGDFYPGDRREEPRAATSLGQQREEDPRLHLRPDVRHGGPQPSARGRGHQEELRHRHAPLLGNDPAQRGGALAGPGAHPAEAAAQIPAPEHRQREQRRGAQDGEALHRGLRGDRHGRLLARRHRQRQLRFLRERQEGLRPGRSGRLRDPGAQRLPLPGAPLPRQVRPHLHEGRHGDVRHAVHRRRGGDHCRARHQRGRRHRAAREVTSRPCRPRRGAGACCWSSTRPRRPSAGWATGSPPRTWA